MKQLNLMGQKVLSKREEKKALKDFEERFMSIFRPYIVPPNYETMPIPEQLKKSIPIERCLLVIKGERLATEIEALWYISCSSLIAPLRHDHYNIMMYLTRKWMIAEKKELPDFLKAQIVLEELEERELYNLRHWIYKKGMGQ